MDATGVRQIREDMERADARRLQPDFVAQSFEEAFKLIGERLSRRRHNRHAMA